MNTFQFTIEHTFGERLDMLLGWLEHFRRVGQSAGLVVHDGRISVWRAGPRLGTESDHDKPVGMLWCSANGFDEVWRSLGGTLAKDNAPKKD